MKRKWINKNITILGLSKSGIAAAKYLANKGASCTISEKREATDNDRKIIEELNLINIKVEMGEHKAGTILESYLVITSPGIPPKADVFKLIRENNIEVISEVELAFHEVTAPFIAITGTNGKTTVTKLVSEIFETAGFKAPSCGNIGTPPSELIDQKIDYFVTEVSSYQIATSNNFKPQIACFLNYAPDHIDWHGGEEEYYKAKASLFTGNKTPGWAVFNACDQNVLKIRKYCNSKKYYFGKEMNEPCVFIDDDAIIFKKNNAKETILKISEIPILGEHNKQNVMAAVAISKIAGVDNSHIRQAIAKFKPPEHRLEFVNEIEGIKFYNDSKATNCDSAICALQAFSSDKIVLIAGGRDKGTDLTEFVNTIKKHASAVVLMGEAAERFDSALKSSGYNNIHKAKSFEHSIDIASSIASDLGDASVLLSPACASFDMFKNFEERGKAFKDYVNKKK